MFLVLYDSTSTHKTLCFVIASNKDTDQFSHSGSLISTFVVCSLEIYHLNFIHANSLFLAVDTGLSRVLSETLKIRFVVSGWYLDLCLLFLLQ